MANKLEKEYLIDRDISWLYSNYRVLQEAMNTSVPLYERIKFLAIYSSNLDEFFRVRVAYLRRLKLLEKTTRKELLPEKIKPKKILEAIKNIVQKQQTLFGEIFRHQILPELEKEGIHLIPNEHYTTEEKAYAIQFFENNVLQHIKALPLGEGNEIPILEDRFLYFTVQFKTTHNPCIIKIPTQQLSRFIVFPQKGNDYRITFLDDIVRFNLPEYFLDKPIEGIYAIKISRDAELYLGDELDIDLVEQITASLAKRQSGTPTRFLYDSQMPEPLLEQLQSLLDIKDDDLMPGARYHNFHDFFRFPNLTENPLLQDLLLPPLPHYQIQDGDSIMGRMQHKDIMLHFPYQRYDYVLQFLRESAYNKQVKQIKITLYRVAEQSEVAKILIEAVKQGKQVTVFVEAKARFDEASNLYWGKELQQADAKVIYSFPDIKVHSKILLVIKEVEEKKTYYSYIGTGNFNEKTAKLYSDHALLTYDQKIGREVHQVFYLLERRILIPRTERLLVSPFSIRTKFEKMIQREIKNAQKGLPAYMIIKMNSLEDADIIEKLVEASQAGVNIKMIIRGICRLVPHIKGYTDNIEIISIVDRFLEHARVYIFCNGGNEKMYMASADWMLRNLDRRVEVAVPIRDRDAYKELRDIIDIQLADNQKARLINKEQSNEYKYRLSNEPKVRSQQEIYNYLKVRVELKLDTSSEDKPSSKMK
jgi:polyphosphate kinase